MKPAFIQKIVELYIERCEYSMVVDRKNLELTVLTHLWSSDKRGSFVKYAEEYIEDWVSMILTDLHEDDRVAFVVRKEEFEYEGRTFTAKANYIVNKKYDCYLSALVAEIEGR
jgi:hypothetical protein